MVTYVAFLLGINVGGHRKVAMSDLKRAVQASGFQNVRTLLNSGNVVFELAEKDASVIMKKFELLLQKTFGFEVKVITRTMKDIQKLVASDPFKKITITPDTRLYITFLTEKPTTDLEIPYETPEEDFKIIKVTDSEVISVLTLSPTRRTTDGMNILVKGFGKTITTRNWNTILKIAAFG